MRFAYADPPYTDIYVRSFNNLIARAKKAGYVLERTPGKRGGEWGAIYKLTSSEPQGGSNV